MNNLQSRIYSMSNSSTIRSLTATSKGSYCADRSVKFLKVSSLKRANGADYHNFTAIIIYTFLFPADERVVYKDTQSFLLQILPD
jgi:hypothetical protein